MPFSIKTLLKILLAVMLLALAVVGLCFALLASSTGTQWLASQAEHQLDGLVQWQSLQGSMLGPITLQGVRFTQPGLAAEIERLTLDWQPIALLRGQLQIDNLQLERTRVVLSSTDAVDTAEPLDPASLQLPLNISLPKVGLQGLEIVQDDGPVQIVDEIKLTATLEENELLIALLQVDLPDGGVSLTGRTTLANSMPVAFEADWHWQLPGQGPDIHNGDDIPLKGSVMLKGRLQWLPVMDFDMAFGAEVIGLEPLSPELPAPLLIDGSLIGQYQEELLSLTKIELALADMTVAAQGKVSLPTNEDPSVELEMFWADVQWPPLEPEPEVVSAAGSLQLAGGTADYSFALAADLAGKDLPPGEWRGAGYGGLSGMTLSDLHGSLLGGEVSLSGPVTWAPNVTWELQVQASSIDPQSLLPDIPGSLDLVLQSSGGIEPEQDMVAAINLERLSGTLMGYDLAVTAEANLVGTDLQLANVLLTSDGNQLSASGKLSPSVLSLDWQLRAETPGTVIDGVSGLLLGQGAVSGALEQPEITAEITGRKLQWENFSVPSMNLSLQAGLAADAPLHIDAQIESIAEGDQKILESLGLNASGTTSRQQLQLTLATQQEQLDVGLTGGLDIPTQTWSGMLSALEARHEEFGLWSLRDPAALSVAASAVTLAQSCLESEQSSAEVCARAQWRDSGQAQFSAQLRALPLSLMVPNVTGDAAGTLDAELLGDGAIAATGSFSITPGLVSVELDQSVKQLTHGGGNLDLNIGAQGLDARMHIAAPEQGVVDANVVLPAFTSFPLADKQPLSGKITASLPDLSGLAGWVSEVSSSAGQLHADLALAGTLQEPLLEGEMALTNGAATIPVAGLQLRKLELRALAHPSRAGVLDVTGGVESGDGRIDLSGQFDTADSTLALQLTGKNFQVYDTRDASVRLSPELDIGWLNETLVLRGELTIPKADITPKLQISPAMMSSAEVPETPGQVIGPSADVVVVDASVGLADGPLQPEAPFRIDSEIELIFGDRVRVNTLGFISRVSGAVVFTNRPEQIELIPIANGRLSLEDGTFRAFGQDLDIETGQLIFADVPADQPELNVRAVRWIDGDPKVTAAGVLVTGSVTEPTLELFSRPQLETSEIQSYLLTGRSSGDRNNVLSIGTYVSPRIYVGYGYNLLEKSSEFNSLFSITPRYGLGVNVGEADNNVNVTITHEN